MSWHVGKQRADGGPGPSRVWLSDEAGQARCSTEWGGGEKEYIIFDLFTQFKHIIDESWNVCIHCDFNPC